MSKKHFIALANFIKQRQGLQGEFSPEQIEHLADFCRNQNNNFKRDRWIAFIKGECGPNGGAVKA